MVRYLARSYYLLLREAQWSVAYFVRNFLPFTLRESLACYPERTYGLLPCEGLLPVTSREAMVYLERL